MPAMLQAFSFTSKALKFLEDKLCTYTNKVAIIAS